MLTHALYFSGAEEVIVKASQLESKFQSEVIKELHALFPGCVVLMNDASYIQGIPDLTVLWREHHAMLEVKAAWNSSHQPNQDYYIKMFGEYVFSAFIYPENKEEILDGLQQAFRPRRKARVSQR